MNKTVRVGSLWEKHAVRPREHSALRARQQRVLLPLLASRHGAQARLCALLAGQADSRAAAAGRPV